MRSMWRNGHNSTAFQSTILRTFFELAKFFLKIDEKNDDESVSHSFHFNLKDSPARAASCLNRLYQPGLAGGVMRRIRVPGRRLPMGLLIIMRSWIGGCGCGSALAR